MITVRMKGEEERRCDQDERSNLPCKSKYIIINRPKYCPIKGIPLSKKDIIAE